MACRWQNSWFKVLQGEVRLRAREIIRQVCAEIGMTSINSPLSHDLVHMFVEIPPHVSVSDFVRQAKGRSSRKIQSLRLPPNHRSPYARRPG